MAKKKPDRLTTKQRKKMACDICAAEPVLHPDKILEQACAGLDPEDLGTREIKFQIMEALVEANANVGQWRKKARDMKRKNQQISRRDLIDGVCVASDEKKTPLKGGDLDLCKQVVDNVIANG